MREPQEKRTLLVLARHHESEEELERHETEVDLGRPGGGVGLLHGGETRQSTRPLAGRVRGRTSAMCSPIRLKKGTMSSVELGWTKRPW